MEDIIRIKVNGSFLTKDGKNAGAKGSGNAVRLEIEFDEGWLGFAKRIVWRDAKGENETSVILTPQIESTPSFYTTLIPPEATVCEGWCSFTLEGYYEASPSKAVKTATDTLYVSFSENSPSSAEPTKNEIMQLQGEFESLMPSVSQMLEETKTSVNNTIANLLVWEEYNEEHLYRKGNKVHYKGRSYACTKDCFSIAPDNELYWVMIADRGETGSRGPQGVQGIPGERGEKGEKGERGEKGDKGERGDKGEQGINGTIVPSNGYYSFSVDENGDLWVNYPDAENAPDIALNENGELILSVGDKSSQYNMGKVTGEAGYTPKRGDDYWTESDIAEIKGYIDERLGIIENGSY